MWYNETAFGPSFFLFKVWDHFYRYYKLSGFRNALVLFMDVKTLTQQVMHRGL